MAGNPFVEQLDRLVEAVIGLATDERVLVRVAALPDNAEDRLEAIQQTLEVRNLHEAGVALPEGTRLAPRWFEDPALAGDAERYVPQKYVDGYPPGTKPPRPTPTRPGPGLTVCASVGVVLCGSVGG